MVAVPVVTFENNGYSKAAVVVSFEILELVPPAELTVTVPTPFAGDKVIFVPATILVTKLLVIFARETFDIVPPVIVALLLDKFAKVDLAFQIVPAYHANVAEIRIPSPIQISNF